MKHPLSIIFILFACCILNTPVTAQQNTPGKGLFLGVGTQGGISMLQTGDGFYPGTESGNGFVGELSLTYFFTPNVGIGISPGYSTFNTILTGKLDSETFFSSEVSPYYLENNPNEFIPYVLFASDSIKERMQLGYIDLPLLLKFRLGKGKVNGYFDIGGAWSYLPNGPEVTGEAYVDFRGLFTDQNVLLESSGFGFEKQKVVQATPFDPGLSNSLISAVFGAGISYWLSPKTALEFGAVYRRGLTSVMEGTEVPETRREGEFAYRSLLSGGGSLSPSSLNLKVGISMNLGGGNKMKKPKSQKRKGKKLDCDPQIIPLMIRQIPNSRRNLWEDDPEFESVAIHVLNRVEFLQKNVSVNFGGIEYCPLENEAEELQASLSTGTEGIRYDIVQSGYMSEAGQYQISLEPEKRPLSIEVVDADNNFSLDGFQTYVSFQDRIMVPLQYMNFRDTIPDLYAHPAITYELHIETPFYKKAIINIDRTALIKGFIRVELHKIRKKRN